MEIDARDQSLQSLVDRQIEEASHEENLLATGDARGQLAAAQGQLKSLQEELAWATEAVKRVDQRTVVAENRCDEVLMQLSSLEGTCHERDEALTQRDEAWRQCEAIKTDYENAQAHCETLMSQKDEALARIVVLEQELGRRSKSLKDLTLATEESKLQNQQLCQEVKALERRCSALLEDAKLIEDKVRLAGEERLQVYKESTEFKSEVDQACQRFLQEYKGSLEFKTELGQACKNHLQLYKDSSELKAKIEEACEPRTKI
ncbi:putative golgin subfamily A member 6-like protein 19 [Manihot esculenta]|uniref:putative golgin subfamily A member 6-like protein 19 n=1 Tax=Manihot esculenta TaxID=3983 RepID=UPI000B5D505B|nr:putative golgin subfamily A member 6-like protein 19 [Manihot esculenta]